jgi:hypothetical protein
VDGVAAGAVAFIITNFGHGFGIGYIGGGDDGCYQVRRVPTPYGYRLRTINVCEY